VRLIKDYLDDEDSGNYGLLMEWKNPFIPMGREKE